MSFITEDPGYVECLTIYMGVFFATCIAAICDWIKEKQFLRIRDEVNNATVMVYRGHSGNPASFMVRDLVVGDVIDIQAGDRVPADCVMIEETNVVVDQSMYIKVETAIEKSLSVINDDGTDNHLQHPDPFLLAGAKIMSGSGRAIVCAVGENTRMSQNQTEEDLIVKEQHTYLEQKLQIIADQITEYATLMAILIVFTMGVFTILRLMI